MIYGVNEIELGINEILQLIELALGEGKSTITKVFISKIIS